MMRCPFCKKAAHVRTSRYLSDNVKQSYLQCVNVFCSATFRAIESIDEVIRPPAETAPPATAPVAAVPPRRVLDCARSSLRPLVPAPLIQEKRYEPYTTGAGL